MAFNPNGLTAAQLKELKGLLDTKLSGLDKEIRELETEITTTENSQQGAPDEVDRSSFEEEMQRMQLVLDGKNRLRDEVSEALDRFEDGTYGVCEETEEPIGFKRLQAQPWTRLSIDAQSDLERRNKNNPLSGRSGASSPFGAAYGRSGSSSSDPSSDS